MNKKILCKIALLGLIPSFLASCDSSIQGKNPKSYTLNLNQNINDAGAVSGSGTYLTGSEVKITATVNEGYSFDGWYNKNTRLATTLEYIFEMPSNNIKYTAKYSINSYKVTVTSDNNLKGVASGNGTFTYGGTVTVEARPIVDQYSLNKNVFLGWFNNGTLISENASYSFTMPNKDVNLVAKFGETKKTTGDTILFGNYPQSKVTDEKLIENLKEKVGDFPPTKEEQYDFVSYNWYKENVLDNTLGYYKDLDVDEDGTFDYRAVYINEYRPKTTSDNAEEDLKNTYQDSNGYKCGSNYLYFFKYDPIEWKILQCSNNDYFVASTKLLDIEQFNNYIEENEENTGEFEGKLEKFSPNNYKYSELRNFLNEDLFNAAFTTEEAERIQVTDVDNSAKSAGYESSDYACENTSDKLFPLSYEEIHNEDFGFANNKARMFKPTEYAKCMGAFVSFDKHTTEYWLRSASNANENEVRRIGLDGSDYNYDTRVAYFGVLPAMHIN